jgi:hypothetical protein
MTSKTIKKLPRRQKIARYEVLLAEFCMMTYFDIQLVRICHLPSTNFSIFFLARIVWCASFSVSFCILEERLNPVSRSVHPRSGRSHYEGLSSNPAESGLAFRSEKRLASEVNPVSRSVHPRSGRSHYEGLSSNALCRDLFVSDNSKWSKDFQECTNRELQGLALQGDLACRISLTVRFVHASTYSI